eukprot:TRINITY_DN5074_c0_g1_i2.p1 TRINITY_DN5074_c0_g1~~TRINITY_DN5074_c0_g1_i2.p1  ORF type:complete len:1412 (-),score=377.56 TRINITY_DN5074_c0_g1_i2:96-4214(-)
MSSAIAATPLEKLPPGCAQKAAELIGQGHAAIEAWLSTPTARLATWRQGVGEQDVLAAAAEARPSSLSLQQSPRSRYAEQLLGQVIWEAELCDAADAKQAENLELEGEMAAPSAAGESDCTAWVSNAKPSEEMQATAGGSSPSKPARCRPQSAGSAARSLTGHSKLAVQTEDHAAQRLKLWEKKLEQALQLKVDHKKKVEAEARVHNEKIKAVRAAQAEFARKEEERIYEAWKGRNENIQDKVANARCAKQEMAELMGNAAAARQAVLQTNRRRLAQQAEERHSERYQQELERRQTAEKRRKDVLKERGSGPAKMKSVRELSKKQAARLARIRTVERDDLEQRLRAKSPSDRSCSPPRSRPGSRPSSATTRGSRPNSATTRSSRPSSTTIWTVESSVIPAPPPGLAPALRRPGLQRAVPAANGSKVRPSSARAAVGRIRPEDRNGMGKDCKHEEADEPEGESKIAAISALAAHASIDSQGKLAERIQMTNEPPDPRFVPWPTKAAVCEPTPSAVPLPALAATCGEVQSLAEQAEPENLRRPPTSAPAGMAVCSDGAPDFGEGDNSTEMLDPLGIFPISGVRHVPKSKGELVKLAMHASNACADLLQWASGHVSAWNLVDNELSDAKILDDDIGQTTLVASQEFAEPTGTTSLAAESGDVARKEDVVAFAETTLALPSTPPPGATLSFAPLSCTVTPMEITVELGEAQAAVPEMVTNLEETQAITGTEDATLSVTQRSEANPEIDATCESVGTPPDVTRAVLQLLEDLALAAEGGALTAEEADGAEAIDRADAAASPALAAGDEAFIADARHAPASSHRFEAGEADAEGVAPEAEQGYLRWQELMASAAAAASAGEPERALQGGPEVADAMQVEEQPELVSPRRDEEGLDMDSAVEADAGRLAIAAVEDTAFAPMRESPAGPEVAAVEETAFAPAESADGADDADSPEMVTGVERLPEEEEEEVEVEEEEEEEQEEARHPEVVAVEERASAAMHEAMLESPAGPEVAAVEETAFAPAESADGADDADSPEMVTGVERLPEEEEEAVEEEVVVEEEARQPEVVAVEERASAAIHDAEGVRGPEMVTGADRALAATNRTDAIGPETVVATTEAASAPADEADPGRPDAVQLEEADFGNPEVIEMAAAAGTLSRRRDEGDREVVSSGDAPVSQGARSSGPEVMPPESSSTQCFLRVERSRALASTPALSRAQQRSAAVEPASPSREIASSFVVVEDAANGADHVGPEAVAGASEAEQREAARFNVALAQEIVVSAAEAASACADASARSQDDPPAGQRSASERVERLEESSEGRVSKEQKDTEVKVPRPPQRPASSAGGGVANALRWAMRRFRPRTRAAGEDSPSSSAASAKKSWP